MRHLLLCLLCLSYGACVTGDIGSSSDDSDSSVDNSVDNSVSGISSCTVGTSIVCEEVGPGEFEVTQECQNADGSPVVIDGPNLSDVCPVEEEEPAEEEAEEDVGLNQEGVL